MSWHDPARSLEPASETALRNELRGLLGMPAPATSYFEAEPTPELILLADDLKREAQRRNRTFRKRNSWMLMAAALPFALALGGVGAWGVSQKHKADLLAAAVAQQQAQIQRLAANQQQPHPAGTPAPVAAPATRTQPQVLLMGKTAPRNKPKELVIPVQRSAEPNASDTQRVKVR